MLMAVVVRIIQNSSSNNDKILIVVLILVVVITMITTLMNTSNSNSNNRKSSSNSDNITLGMYRVSRLTQKHIYKKVQVQICFYKNQLELYHKRVAAGLRVIDPWPGVVKTLNRVTVGSKMAKIIDMTAHITEQKDRQLAGDVRKTNTTWSTPHIKPASISCSIVFSI